MLPQGEHAVVEEHLYTSSRYVVQHLSMLRVLSSLAISYDNGDLNFRDPAVFFYLPVLVGSLPHTR